MRFLIAFAIVMAADTIGRFSCQPSQFAWGVQIIAVAICFFVDMAHYKTPAKPKQEPNL